MKRTKTLQIQTSTHFNINLFKVILTGCALLLFVSGCSGSASSYEIIYQPADENNEDTQKDQSEEKNYTIAVVPKITGIPFFNVAGDGAYEAGEHLGVDVIFTGPTVADAKHQIDVIEQLIADEVDAIAIAANDPEALTDVMLKAQQQGIKVLTWDSDTNPMARSFFVNQVNGETLGRHLMDLLASYTKEKGRFAIMTGSLTAKNLNEWIKWIKVQQDNYYPNMELVEIVANDENPQQAYAIAVDLLERYPDLRGVIGVGTIGPPAISQAILDLKREGVYVVGSSTPSVMRPYIESGTAPVITLWSPQKLGYLTVVLAKQLIDGNIPYDGQHIPNVGYIRVEGDVVIMGEPLDFTKENVAEYDF